MIAPTFEPEAAPGAGIASYDAGVDRGLSWMEKRQQQQLTQQRIQEEIDMQPVKALKRQADQRTYEAAITNAAILEETRRQAADVAPHALGKFLEITKIPNVDDRAAALDSFAGEIAWLGNIPQNKGFIDAVNDARGKAHLDAIAMGKIAQAKDAVQQRATTADAQIEQRAQQAELAATTKVQMQAKDLAHKREVDELNMKIKELESQTKKDVATTSADSRTAAATIAGDAHTESAKIASDSHVQSSAGRVYAEEASSLERAAGNETDDEAKMILRKKAQVYRDKAEKALKGDKPAATTTAVVAPTRVSKDATTITVGGNTYPVFKDASGNRAYKVDDHFVPLATD